MKIRYDKILVYITIGLMLIPYISQHFLKKEDVEPLYGTIEFSDSVQFIWKNIEDKTWQKNKEEILKKNLLIRPILIRMQNDLDFRFFDEYHMGDLLVGKNGFYFSKGWAEARCCVNNLNKDTLSSYVKKLKTLSDLFNQKGKYFRVIIPPSKEEFFSNELPDEYINEKPNNDYHLYLNELKKNKIAYWDLLDFYKKVQDTVQYPVYSKTSVHWTNYGASFTLMNLLADMNKFFDNQMSKIYVESQEVSKFKNGDGDTEATLNLFTRIDNSDFLYNRYKVDSNRTPFKPKVLTIADSFYWQIIYCWKLSEMFSSDSKYLYYYNSIFFYTSTPSKNIKEINIIEEFKTADALIILNSSHNLLDYPFGFQYDIDKVIEGLKTLPDKH